MNLAEGGPNFASFAKFGGKIANLATRAWGGLLWLNYFCRSYKMNIGPEPQIYLRID